MARKFDLISELYNRYTKQVVSSPENWQAFLNSACRNYKLRFDEQLLVYAQRPDATAILEIEKWNGTFGRWVNRGATGIAVFEDVDRTRQRLVHYFDISDTHTGRYSRPVPIWQMKPEYTEEVIATLESTFGELNYKDTLEEAIVSASENAVEDNMEDYLDDLMDSTEDSFLEGLDRLSVSVLYRTCVTNSVAYMMMARLGMNPADYFDSEDFRDVTNFTTQDTLTALGVASSDIAEMGLAEISRTIFSLEKQNRIIAENDKPDYNKGENKTERSFDNGENRVHNAGRLPSSEPHDAGAAGSGTGQVRRDEEKVPEGTSQGEVLQPAHQSETDRASGGSGEPSQRDGRNAGTADGETGRRDGEPESGGYDELGSEDEQHPEQSAGDRESGSDFRLEYYDRSHEDRSLPFFGKDDDIHAILLKTPYLKASKDEIRAFLETKPDSNKRTEYIKGLFNNDYTELILDDGRRVGYKTMQNVLHLWEGSYTNRTAQSYYDWGVIAAHFEGLRLLGELHDEMKPLPSMEGQMTLMTENAEQKRPAFSFSQELIDTVLCRGSGVSEGKMRIYEQFSKSLSAKENADFLKDEYGWGGSYPVITGTGIDEQHDGKGIRLQRGFGEENPHITLTWSQVEKRIAELIKVDRYLNPKEKAAYPEWLNAQEQRRAELEVERKNREILAAAPPEKEKKEDAAYEYHLGDPVYIGSSEYEILAFDEKTVKLYDTTFPLFNKEFSREEFDQKVKENPLNDHLKVQEKKPFLDRYYVVEDLQVRGQLEPTHYETLDDALKAYQKLPIDKVKALGVYKTANPMPGCFDFIQCIDGKDKLITDYQGTPDWQNPEVEALVAEIQKYLTPEKEAVLPAEPAGWNDYNSIKEQNPDSLVLYQVGDFFELYGEDAKTAAQALDISLITRSIPGVGTVSMCGIPSNRLDPYMDMLTDRGYDLVIADFQNGERSTFSVPSKHKDNPVASKPIGRIDYLGTNGIPGESIEYTDPILFEKDIKDNNFSGVPMEIVLYKDESGTVVPHGFIYNLDPPANGLKIEENPYFKAPLAHRLLEFIKDYDFYDYQDNKELGETDEDLEFQLEKELHSKESILPIIESIQKISADDNLTPQQKFEAESLVIELNELAENTNPTLDKAMDLIDAYCRDEFQSDEGADYSDLTSVDVGYTTTEDDKHEIHARVNLERFKIETLVDDVVVRQEQYESLADMVENALPYLDFEELTAVSDEEIAKTVTEPKPPAPVWEKKKAKAQSYDIHPEIPMAERVNFNLSEHPVEEVPKKERFRRNLMAIQLLKKCESENRFATPDEQLILSKYVGWGGIPEAFDPDNSSWATEYLELKTVLDADEYASAKESTLTAFYTPPEVVFAVYKALENMGFQQGNLLEPSCGIGHFIGMLPEKMKESKVYGVELDKISAGIAQQLYQQSSIAAQGYEAINLPDSFFDGVIGNVPFGDFKVLDKRYDKQNFLIHDYFMAKSLDKLRPGGVMALITSKGTMDKENPAVRKYIAQRADLLGAIRLPNNTFKGNAGTEVVSDILIFQKRDRIVDLEPDWVHLNVDENGRKMNSYFVDHPEMVLGEWKTVSGRFGQEDTVLPYEGSDLAEQLEEAVSNIHGEISAYEQDEELEEEDNSIPADPTVRNFSYTVVDGKVYYRENSRMTPPVLSATAENRIKGMIEIRDTVRNLIELQTEDFPDEDIKAAQEKLNEVYDRFTKKYGLLSDRANKTAFSQDSSYSLLSALEVLDDEGKLERKADMFTKRTIKPHIPVTSVDTASEAFALSMGEKARVDMEYMCELTGKSEEEIYNDLKGVIFLNPMYGYGDSEEPKYLPADEYLSGNVREKLATARRTAQLYPEDYTVNVEALEKVQPKDLSASEIAVRLGATWVPPEIVEQFMFEFLDTPRYAQWNIKVHFSKFNGEWNVEGKSYDRSNVKAYSTYGTSRINAYKIIEETLNLRDVRIFDYIEDENGKRKAVLNKKETAIAQSKQEMIKQGFKDWIWEDPTRRERLTKMYNERFNSLRPREYDGSHIEFAGMNPEIELREHQKNAVAHILYGGNTLLAHCVGAGKTFEMTAAAMESKRLGLCSKSLFVVPNHLTEQWAAEFLQLYPSANILVATKKDFETKNRKRFCGRIATGDYDAIIIGHSQFEKIPMSIERQRAILEQQLQEVIDGIADLKHNRGDNFSVKQMEKTKKSLKLKLEKLNDQSRKDDVVTFEELGVDRLFIDESHFYKNLFLYTKMRNVGGIAQTEAQKSSDLFMKCRYLDELTGGRGTVFATGTPISNSMVELYTIQRYLQYNTLQMNGLQHFDAWASTFGETVTAVELTPEGSGYRAKTRFARFYNLPELMAMFKEVADIQTADMLKLPVPKAHYHNVAVKPSEIQKDLVASLSDRAEKVRNGMVNASEDNMLLITNDGRKLALDQRLTNDMLPDFEGSKVNACVDNIVRIWEDTAEKKSAQLVFCDLSTPKGDGTFSVYDDIRKKLIERGIPAEEVKFIHEADTEAKKQDLFKKVRRGEVRVLMGSTFKMGAGTNCQDKLIALHDIDCPWRPSDLEQRSGRIIRQGNENKEVGIYRYVTEETFDAYLYQLVEGKQKFASQIMTSKSPVRSAEDIDETALSYAEIKMLATGNPYIKEKMDLDIQVQKLRLLKSNYLTEKYSLEDKIIKFYPAEIARLSDTIAGLKQDIERVNEHPKPADETFIGMQVKGVFFSEKADAGQAILDACKAMTSPDPVSLGEYRGFKMELYFESMSREYRVKLKGNLSYPVTLGSDIHGNITRLDNALEGLSKRLEMTEQQLDNTKKQLETAKKDVEKPFNQEDELTAKTARLAELDALLNVDKKENELVEGEPDEGDEDRKSKNKDRER